MGEDKKPYLGTVNKLGVGYTNEFIATGLGSYLVQVRLIATFQCDPVLLSIRFSGRVGTGLFEQKERRRYVYESRGRGSIGRMSGSSVRAGLRGL